MPEGPEARIMADMLSQRITGKYLLSMTRDTKYKKTANILNWNSFTKLLPLKILKVKAKGKKVIWKFPGKRYLVTSLGMTGLYFLKEDKYTRVRFSIGEIGYSGEAQVLLVEKYIYFSDKRNFANLYFNLSKIEYKKQMKDVGFDLLAYSTKSMEPDKPLQKLWLSRCRESKYAQTQICVFLLIHQKEFAGIGNYLKADILFLSRIHPGRVMSSFSKKELLNLLKISLETIYDSYSKGGRTIGDFRNPRGKKGDYESPCYGKVGKGFTTGKFKDGRSNTYYHKKLQPE